MINISKLTQRLKEFESGQNSKYLWKPKEGSQVIRIVPYRFDPETPFIELKFYYKLGGKNYLAPCTFGKPDPVMDLVDTLRSSGSTEEKELAKKFSPVTRTYCPIITRPCPITGDKPTFAFWGFGAQVYKQLLQYITDPNWGDITSLTEGHDLTVKFIKESKKKTANGQALPETIITPIPRKTVAIDKSDGELMEIVKNQINILDIFPLPSVEELKNALDKSINPEGSGSGPDPIQDPTDPTDSTIASPKSVTEQVTSEAMTKKKSLTQEFGAFFDR